MSEKNRENIISEKLFAEMRDTIFFQVHRIQKAIFRKGNHLFQEQKIPLQLEQFPILLTVHTLEGLSQKDIAEITHRDKSSIQRTLVVLEKRGFIRVVQDAADKRRNLVFVTDAGRYVAENIKEIMKQTEKETFSIFSESERAVAIKNIKEIADKLENV